MKNQGAASVQLLRRRWFIIDGNELLEEVAGDGVVGDQPVLDPGDSYAYSSFCVLATPVGCMHGFYTFVDDHGGEFSAEIPMFTLADNMSLH
ncbi:MAG: Co2+/Mg2+ efflux protein ApaG [Zetaproteobacteria bacterium CG17_big_fil_post_rev_8_21_14_2_50_50_13]|nr:MAG: Co2+/Mg2+ efflux protein ApaG [Zetaproteobacteria bacterium CG17_big_fil_post_rev_8_21_14_2_50_50_13]PIY56512.1 MAG: Co2+/Mg2+ efflux protein ApaG [Zetaproteobacteria bacterium CG_4_10_14_0_8_um_filter_49_80]